MSHGLHRHIYEYSQVPISSTSVDPTGVNQPGVMIQQPGVNYDSGAGIQHPPPQQGPVGYELQPQTSAGYQYPPEYTTQETKSTN